MSIFVGICGGTGSGKSSVARAVMKALPFDTTLLEVDAYYKDVSHFSQEELSRYNFDHPNALDLDLMAGHVQQLKENQPIQKPVYEFAEHRRCIQTEEVVPQPVVIVEGIFAFHPLLVRSYDYKVFVSVSEEERIKRRLERDLKERKRSAAEILLQYQKTVKPMHELFVEPAKKYADTVLFWEAWDDQLILDVCREIQKRKDA